MVGAPNVWWPYGFELRATSYELRANEGIIMGRLGEGEVGSKGYQGDKGVVGAVEEREEGED